MKREFCGGKMIKTFYTDSTQIRQLAADFPDAVEAAAALNDLGLTLTNSSAEFTELCTKDLFLSGRELGGGYYVVMHTRSETLPETQPDPCPVWNPPHRRIRAEWWKRSREFWRHAVKFGFCTHDRQPLTNFLKERFNVRAPWYLSDAQYAEAWRAVAWGPPQATSA
jgi:hypothetical protein